MFRLITLVCLVHFSVGGIIRGRVLLYGDLNKSDRVPTGSKLAVELQDTSRADAAAVVLGRVQLSNLFAFPFTFQLDIPRNIQSSSQYTLSARITNGDNLLYINDQSVSIKISGDSPISADIPVIAIGKENPSSSIDDEQQSWPEMLGREGAYAVQYIKEKSGLTNVFIFPEGSPMTLDYRTDRVRVIVNKNGIVSQVPRTG